MAHVTSRGFGLPDSKVRMSDGMWFNLWQMRLWPFHEIRAGDELYWYETPSKAIVWRTRIHQVESFSYSSLQKALDVMDDRFGVDIDRSQEYLVGKPPAGFCLGYRVDALERVFWPKPPTIPKFSQQGWERGSRPEIAEWIGVGDS
jgi:hypothetical protein